jgi:hypothetical protein
LWTEASPISANRGGHLVTITDAGESNFINTNISQLNSNGAWIGLRNIGAANNFKWVTGEPLLFTNWAPGKPDNIGGNIWTQAQPYVHIIGGSASGAWNDTVNTQMRFITEYDSAVVGYRQISGVANGSMQAPGVYTICYERRNSVSGKKDTCCFSITVTCGPTVIAKGDDLQQAQPINGSKFEVVAYPNPTSNSFVLRLQTDNGKDLIQIRVTDIYGRVVELKNGVLPNSTIRFGNQYPVGVYFSQVIQGKDKMTLKLIKQ